MSTPRRGLRRPSKDDGPRASLRQLLPFLLEHKRVLVVVGVLSVLEAAATLVQPLLVGDVIGRVQAVQFVLENHRLAAGSGREYVRRGLPGVVHANFQRSRGGRG